VPGGVSVPVQRAEYRRGSASSKSSVELTKEAPGEPSWSMVE
jgi:hypothetical protein